MLDDTLTKNTKHLLHALFQSGVRNFIVSPGSRTTPIALLLAEYEYENPDLTVYIDVDERSASFFALGIAKVTQQPVAVLGTSGTAITEYMSAVAEAAISHIPLIVLSTDRPSELQNNGAPQTLPQNQIYGNLTKQFISFTLQDTNSDVTEYIDFMTQKLVHEIQQQPAGPLQINIPLRKPLMPKLGIKEEINIKPLVFVTNKNDMPTLSLHQHKVLILAGPNESDDYKDSLMLFSKQNHVPVIADILSRVRTSETIYGIDALIKHGDITKQYKPDLVIRFGATPVSANVLQWIKSEEVPVWHVDEHAGTDHTRHISRAFQVSPKVFLENVQTQNNADFYELWQGLNNKKRQVLGEARIAQILDTIVSKNTPIFLANSMAVRDGDDVFSGKQTQRVYANRGVNGIDGVISTALGMSATTKQRSVLLTGDLTLFHDMNGLMMAKKYQLPIDIIVINNNGGSIFSFLPQATADQHFEKMFGTPLDIDMSKVAQLYDLDYCLLDDPTMLADVYHKNNQGPRLIELKSNRMHNVANHRQLLEDLENE